MIEKKTTALYEKQGRKYVPVRACWHEDHNVDQMKTGSFRLVYAYTDGGRRYEYDVTAATAGAVAAMLIAKEAMVNAICEASKMRPNTSTNYTKYTKRQQAAIARFREEMGGMYPSWWAESSAYEIADAAINAVLEFKP